MSTYTAHRPQAFGNIPMSFAPLLFSDPSYFEADRAPNSVMSTQGDGIRFIARLGRILHARG